MIKDSFFINQSDVNDCGIACIAMILRLNKIDVSLDVIKSKCNITEDGISAYEIIKILKKYNINYTGYKDVMIKNIKTPAIVLTLNNDNTCHFMVVLKVLKNKVLVADPYTSVKYINLSFFNKIYSSIALLPDYNTNILKDVFSSKKDITRIIANTFILIFLSFIFSLMTPITINLFVKKTKLKYIILILFNFLCIGFIKNYINYKRENSLIDFEKNINKKLTIPFINKIIDLPYNIYYKNGSGTLLSKVSDLSYVKEMGFNIIEVLVINISLLFIIMLIILFLNPLIFIIDILFIFLLYLINRYFYKNNVNYTFEAQMYNEEFNNFLVDDLNTILMVKNYRKEDYIKKDISFSYNKYLDSYEFVNKKYRKKEYIESLITICFIFVSTVIIIYNGDVSLLIYLFSFQNSVISSIEGLNRVIPIYMDYKSSYIRVKDIYDKKDEISEKNIIDINNICFRNVAFKYKDKVVLNNVNLNINKGDWVLIKGNTGSGKSTLFKLLTKQIECYDLDILINGKKISSINKDVILNSITYVDQKIKLLNKSIKENIFYDKEVDNSLLDTFLINESLNLDLIINNLNQNVSGGQISLIAMAGAFNNDSNVVILDETTNSLDSNTEERLFKNIKRRYNNKTVILITHRNTNTNYFNKVFTLCNGKIKKGV